MTFSARFKALLPEFLLLLSLAFCLYRLDLSWFNTHMARDLFRADLWLKGTPADWLGPEMGWDIKRLPGPFYYWFLAALSLFGSIENILAAKIIITFTLLYLLLRQIRQQLNSTVLLYFLMLFCLMPVFIFTSRNLWNPSSIIIFNILQLVLLFKFNKSSEVKWLTLSLLVALLGMQVHFSTLIAYLAFAISVVIQSKKHRRTQLLISIPLLVWLTLWYFSGPVHAFGQQLQQFYGFNHFIFQRIGDLKYHLTLTLFELKDYDLFTFLFNALSSLGLIAESGVRVTSFMLGWVYLILFIASLRAIYSNYKKNKNLVDLFLLLHCLFFIISILVLKNKEHIPYRYGLCFYPIQFLILSYGSWLMLKDRKRWYAVFGGLAALSFSFYAYFDAKMLIAQDLTGRTHHTQVDNLEMTYGRKKEIYAFLKEHANPQSDPFNALHGRAANKFRLKEMNWEQTQSYFSLYGKAVSYDLSLPGQNTEKSWLLELASLQELREGHSPLRFKELSPEQLPQNLEITYFKNQNQILTQIWANTGLILPMAFYEKENSFNQVHLHFSVKSGKYLNLLIDDNSDFKFAYSNIYRLTGVKINGQEISPVSVFKGAFLVQNQYVYTLPEAGSCQVDVDLGLDVQYKNYSRIDLYTTDKLPVQEEITKLGSEKF